VKTLFPHRTAAGEAGGAPGVGADTRAAAAAAAAAAAGEAGARRI
jgi:hypothetical protein